VTAIAKALTRRRQRFVVVNQRQVRAMRFQLDLDDDGLRGRLIGPDYRVDLDDVGGVYLRFMDDRFLPEIEAEPPDSPTRFASRSFHDLFGQWAEVAGAVVVNRYESMGSNFSKPYQAQLIAEHGFATPETLITNDPESVRAFAAVHGRLIYKSISGQRSIVSLLDTNDEKRLDRIRDCPVQFQVFVDGPNVRVHTVGERVFATQIASDAVDYRYATRQCGSAAEFTPIEIDDDVAERCVRLSSSLGLELAGLDLKLPSDGRVVCLEVNPSPVFTYYEEHAGQPIADAVAAHLAANTTATRDDISSTTPSARSIARARA